MLRLREGHTEIVDELRAVPYAAVFACLHRLGGDASIGVVTVTNYTVGHATKLNRDFIRAYRAAIPNVTPEDAPNFMTVQTWDALTAIDKAVAAQTGVIDAARTMDVLRGRSFQSPRGTITFDPVTREVHQPMYVQRASFADGHYFNAEIAAFAPGAR